MDSTLTSGHHHTSFDSFLLTCKNLLCHCRFSKFRDATGVPEVPKFWALNGPYRILSHGGHMKKKVPSLKRESLTEGAMRLARLTATYACFRSPKWAAVLTLIKRLMTSLTAYAEHLQVSLDTVTKSQHRLDGNIDSIKTLPLARKRTDRQKIVCILVVLQILIEQCH